MLVYYCSKYHLVLLILGWAIVTGFYAFGVQGVVFGPLLLALVVFFRFENDFHGLVFINLYN